MRENQAKRAKPVVYGSVRYNLAAGAKGSVGVELNRRGRALLSKREKATVTLRLLPKGGAASSTKLTLSRARKGS